MSSKTIAQLFDFHPIDADVGIEIEMEGNTDFPSTGKYWNLERDGSLRGFSAEYVMIPLARKEVDEAITHLQTCLKNNCVKIQYSERAGVHVHVNMLNYTLKNVFTLALLYYCFERVLVRYCGPNREGNHFCLRICDADYVVDSLQLAMKDGVIRYMNDEDMRYASLNFCSMFKYGTLEFRAMETQPDLSKILEWTDMLLALREFATGIEQYSEIPELISAHGPTGFAKRVFGEELFALLNYPEFDNDVMHSMRPIQHLLYMKG